MEETNETALTELVDETVGLQESNFDYSDVSEEEKIILQGFKRKKGIRTYAFIIETGSDLKEAQSIYSKYGNGKFTKWVEEEYGMGVRMAEKYIEVYNSLSKNELTKLASSMDNLGVEKMYSLTKLPEPQQKEVLENAPLEEMNKKEVEQLTKKVKETGEYNEQLLNEIRQEKENAKKTSQEKDEEIKKLQEKVKELESVQSVAQEPQIIEKEVIKEIPVEKVVEVTPQFMINKMKALEKMVAEKTDEIPDYITEELETLRKKVKEQQEELDESKRNLKDIVYKKNTSLGKERQDWGLLGNVINNFLSSASEYTYMQEFYKMESGENKNFIRSQIDRVEKWVIEMKRMINPNENIVLDEKNIIILNKEEEDD